jgi:hypothetical protein
MALQSLPDYGSSMTNNVRSQTGQPANAPLLHQVNPPGRILVVDDESRAIVQLLIKTGHRFSGKEGRMPAGKVNWISREKSTVFLDLTADGVEQSSEHSVVLFSAPV